MDFWHSVFTEFLPFDLAILEAVDAYRPFWLEKMMVFWSEKKVWIPLYAVLIGFWYWKEGKWKTIYALVLIVLCTLLSDQLASSVLKPISSRLRPCHDQMVNEWFHLTNGCGGKFGFVSSHAANTMGLWICVLRLFPSQNLWHFLLAAWVLLTAYSRIYLGAHFPTDILGGWLVGIMSAFLSLWVGKKCIFNRVGFLN